MKEKRNVLLHRDSRRPISTYTREEVVNMNPSGHTVSILGDPSHWVAFRNSYTLTVLGPRMFWKKTSTSQCTFKDGKIYGDMLPFRELLLDALHLDWIRTNLWTLEILVARKDLWKEVFKGNITNPESLCKKFSKKYFNGAYSYAALRRMAQQRYAVNLWDFFYYTVNPNESLLCALEDEDVRFNSQDMLRCCKILNSKINLRWSSKRLHEEHQKQIEQIQKLKIDRMDSAPIAEPFSKDGLSLILSEKDAFLEGMTQHNCIHSCYWRKIKEGNYLVARGVVNGSYIDLGIYVDNGVQFDQVHTIYNGSPSSEVQNRCREWISKNTQDLLMVSSWIKTHNAFIQE